MTDKPQQYFANRPESESRQRQFSVSFGGRSFSFTGDSGVFSASKLDTGTDALLRIAPGDLAGRVLDLGCGWGPVGIILKTLHPQIDITMSDINERAAELARLNARSNRVSAHILVSDGVPKGHRFDHIFLNPPIRAGKEVICRLFDECAEALAKGGSLYTVIRKRQGADSAKKHLLTLFHEVTTIRRQSGFHVFLCKGESARV